MLLYHATQHNQKLPNADKQLVWLENSYHVATLDNDKDLILQKSIDFIQAHARQAAH